MNIENNKKPSVKELMNLFSQTTWAKDRSSTRVSQMISNNNISVCIRIDGKLIGYGRIISDGCFRGLLDDIIVDESFRGKGYSTIIMNELLTLSENIDEIFLNAGHELYNFYQKYGFEKFTGLTMIKRNS